MSILVNKSTKVITQGMTGETGSFHTQQALAYGKPVPWHYAILGTLMLGVYLLGTRTPLALQGSLKLPAWVWVGGVFGAIYVACFTVLIPRIGAASMICLAVLGQVTASMMLDQFGILQAPKPVDAVRIAGALLVLTGVVLVVAPWRAAPKATSNIQADKHTAD